MLPDRVSNLGPLTYESGTLPIALRGPAGLLLLKINQCGMNVCILLIFHCLDVKFCLVNFYIKCINVV